MKRFAPSASARFLPLPHRCVIAASFLLLSGSDAQVLPDTTLQDQALYETIDPGPVRPWVSNVMIGSVLTASLVESYFTWWKDDGRAFRLSSESWFSSHRGIDKAGHFYAAYFLFHFGRDIMLYGGYSASTADFWGVAASLFHSLAVEIGDGLSPYGFDSGDLLFDLAGLGYGYLQTREPFLQNFDFKVSYWFDGRIRSPASFVKDYDAMTVWLSFNVHRLLPESVGSHWPEFLSLAVGYSVDNHEARSQIAFGLDFNLNVISTSRPELLLLRKTANKIRWPAPEVRFTEETRPRYYYLQGF